MRIPRPPEKVLEDLLARTERQPNGCRIFKGCRNADGYGKIAERVDGKVVYWQAHRFVYSRTVGPIPDGMLVCHTCDNPPCVEITHLFLGTDADNARDRTKKGRTPSGAAHFFAKYPEEVRRGERHHNAKLTPEQVRELRRLGKSGMSNKELAERFDIALTYVWQVKGGRTWNHLAEIEDLSSKPIDE